RRYGLAQHEAPAVVARALDLLLGNGKVDRAAVEAALDEQAAQLGQERDRLVQRAGTDRGLHTDVVELGPAAHDPTVDVNGDSLSITAEVDGPQHGWAELVREQARCAFAERERVQRYRAVGQIDRLAPLPRLGFEGPTERHEGGDIGDRVADPVAATR